MNSTICYLDCYSGASGDMIVGALAHAGANEHQLTEGLRSLGLPASFRFERVKRRGISGVKFHVDSNEQSDHRHLSVILEMIARADIPEKAREDAARVFRRIGDVEAEIHQIPVEKVHFHEVGAVDSIADIVGACLGFCLLGIDSIVCSPLNLGSGVAETAHGLLPVPAPATAVLCAGVPVYSRGPQVELTTPTGAAICTTLASGYGALPPMSIGHVGYGAGTRDFAGHANLLRVIIGEVAAITGESHPAGDVPGCPPPRDSPGQ